MGSIPRATIHDLRHTFAINALMGGILSARLQRMLGHSAPAITLAYAQHLPNDYFVGDAQLLSKSLSRLLMALEPIFRSQGERTAVTGVSCLIYCLTLSDGRANRFCLPLKKFK